MSAIEERVVAYLDGELSAKETRAFERELLQPELSRALSEELALRELLQSLPDEDPPADLAARIEETLGISERKSLGAKLFGSRKARAQADEPASAAPNYTAAGLRVGMDVWLGGMSTLLYAAGPLANAPEQLSQRALELATPSKSLGRAALDAAASTVSAVRLMRSVSRLPGWTRRLGFGKAK